MEADTRLVASRKADGPRNHRAPPLEKPPGSSRLGKNNRAAGALEKPRQQPWKAAGHRALEADRRTWKRARRHGSSRPIGQIYLFIIFFNCFL